MKRKDRFSLLFCVSIFALMLHLEATANTFTFTLNNFDVRNGGGGYFYDSIEQYLQ
jgi:hypothetical protein